MSGSGATLRKLEARSEPEAGKRKPDPYMLRYRAQLGKLGLFRCEKEKRSRGGVRHCF